MKLKATRSSFGAFGNVERGQIVTVEDAADAQELIKTGLYLEYDQAAEEREERERAEAEAKADAAKLPVSTSDTKLAEALEELDRATIANGDLTEQLETKSKTIREFRVQLDEQEEKLSALNAQLAKASADLADRDATIATLQAKNSGLSDDLNKSRADLSDRDSAISDLETVIAAQTKAAGETENAGKTRTKKGD